MIHAGARNCPILLCLLLLAPTPSRSQMQIPLTPAKPRATDVVILALKPLNPQAGLQHQVANGLFGDSDSVRDNQILQLQMQIVRTTSSFGPVLLLVPDETTRVAVHQRCNEFQICDLLSDDRVRTKVVPHDGTWIRDFGPQIAAHTNSAYVVHWRYFDIRLEEAKQEKSRELDDARLSLLAARQQEDQPEVLTQGATPDAQKAAISTIDNKLYVLREYAEILNSASPQRSNDEKSAYDVADAVLANPDFAYKTSQVALDGGNLFKLEDGRCLTTRVLRSRNNELSVNLDNELETLAGCNAVTYLEPLPGPVIEHVDMFLFPVGENRLLLASYDLSSHFASEYWSQLSEAQRDLVTNASLAMDLNAERLRHLGYYVIRVPSPFPRIPPDGHTYYPSMLNALVRTAASGFRQVLVPSYKDYETDIQAAALKQMEAAFGQNSEFVSLEATGAAKSQGGIHCLTLSAPLQLSIFGDAADTAHRLAVLSQEQQLDRQSGEAVAHRIPSSGLQGSWVVLPQDAESDPGPLNLYPERMFFRGNQVQQGVFDHLESAGTFTIDSKNQALWSARFQFPDQSIAPVQVQWINPDEVRLIFVSGSRRLLLRRLDSSAQSPFNLAKAAPQHSGGSAAASHKKN